MNIISKFIAEYKYSKKFRKVTGIQHIKYAIKHMFDKEKDFSTLLLAIDKAKKKLRESGKNGFNLVVVTQDFVDNNAEYMRKNNIKAIVVPPTKPILFGAEVIGHYNQEHNKTLTDIRLDIANKRNYGKVDY